MTSRKPHALVVDDQPFICNMLRRELRSKFVVDIATGGRDAVALIQAGKAYALIVCDLVMPDVSGLDVLDAVERSRPDLLKRFVFITGRACSPEELRRFAAIGACLLYKPFGTEELRTVAMRHA